MGNDSRRYGIRAHGIQAGVATREQYLSFLHYAQTPLGHFHNFMSDDQVWLDDMGSEDCFGRVLWACGYTLRAELHSNVKKVALQIFDGAQRWIPLTQSLRARAYMGMGCYHYLENIPDHGDIKAAFKRIADSLCRDYRRNAEPEWAWFDDFLTYSNGMLPRSLFMAYELFGDEEYLKVAEEIWRFSPRFASWMACSNLSGATDGM